MPVSQEPRGAGRERNSAADLTLPAGFHPPSRPMHTGDLMVATSETSDMPHRITRRSFSALLGFASTIVLTGPTRAQVRPAVILHKEPACGCCTGWAHHLDRAGFTVTAIDAADMVAVKARLGVPHDLQSCHTAEIGRYVIEGHIPANAIERLLVEAPDARGLAVPGMPVGSPGMEGGAAEVYDVVLFGPKGHRVFGRFRGMTEV